MVGTVANKLVLTVAHTLLDTGLLTILLSVWSIEDYSSMVKLLTSLVVGGLAVTRWIFFIKDRINGKENKDT